MMDLTQLTKRTVKEGFGDDAVKITEAVMAAMEIGIPIVDQHGTLVDLFNAEGVRVGSMYTLTVVLGV